MRTAIGLKAHSGWAAMVGLAAPGGGDLGVIDRRRLELVAKGEASWAKQPYHAAERRRGPDARALVERGVESARRLAREELSAAVGRLRDGGHDVAACAVLAAEPMPEWTVEEILAVHFRMHKAEGVLFRDALSRAARAIGVKLVEIPEKTLDAEAAKALAMPAGRARAAVAALGRSIGPPWSRDQKDAALAAWVALAGEAR